MANETKVAASRAGLLKDGYLEPSSSTAGFFQEPPKLVNGFYEDAAFRRVLELYLPPSVQESVTPDISSFGDLVLSKKVFTWVADAEKNLPYLKTWDTFGKRKDELVTSEGWRRLQDTGIEEGIVAIPYENRSGPYSRLHQFLKFHLWSGSCATVTCPSGMADGAASLLSRHLSSPTLSPSLRPVLQSAFNHLTSRSPSQAWTSGQWMTERTGGSDVSGTETTAVKTPSPSQSPNTSTGIDGSPLGPYSISGFKFFSSATDANMTILLARTSSSGGLSAFYAPMRLTIPPSPLNPSLPNTELNGVTIQRLKSKLGTRTLPTAELVLSNMRAYMLGAEGNGVKEIATVLNITRAHNAVTAMGYWGRGLAISRAYARVRVVGGRRLADVPAHVKTLAGLEVEYKGWMCLTFFNVLLLGISEQSSDSQSPYASLALPQSHIIPPSASVPLLLRLLTPTLKALTAKASIAALAECMESLGGVGYLDSPEQDQEYNVARLFRDANVLSIWEGTTEVLAGDMVRVLKGRQGSQVIDVVGIWLQGVIRGAKGHREEGGMEELRERWRLLRARIEKAEIEELLVSGREVMLELGRIIAGMLLFIDAERDGDEIAFEIARRWTALGRTAPATDNSSGGKWKEKVKWDRRIVFGDDDAGHDRAAAKL